MKKRITQIGYYLLSIIAPLAILYFMTDLRNLTWSIPFSYGGDPMMALTMIKGLVTHEWFPFLGVKSDLLGAPFGFHMMDFPMFDSLYHLMLSFISIFTSDYAIAHNIFYLSSFPLTTLIFVYAARQLKISFPTAITFGLLYSFLPYHFIRLGHIWLSAYFILPLLVVVITWMWEKQPLFFKNESGYKIHFGKKEVFTIISVIIAGLTGLYYAFFFAIFIAIAAISSFFTNRKDIRYIASAAIIAVILLGSLFSNVISNFVHWKEHGKNLSLVRAPIESEIYGYRISNSLLPPRQHRLEKFSKLKAKHHTQSGIVEGQNESFGLIGALGFLFLISRLLLIRKKEAIYDKYSTLIVSSIFITTVGGLSTLFALAITPDIRAYNRISIFMVAIIFFALAFLIENNRKKLGKCGFGLILSALLVIGIYDQFLPSFGFTKFGAPYHSDKQFIERIEEKVPEGAMIYQLPFMPFPENGPINQMEDYSHLRAYLYSNHLKWSYGVIKGSAGSARHQFIAEQSPDKMIIALINDGYQGIYIDREGYTDFATNLEKEISRVLGKSPISSKDNKLSFFSLPTSTDQLKKALSDEELAELEKSLNPVIETWHDGCHGLEGDKTYNWHWCSNNGKVTLTNTFLEDKKAMVSFFITSGKPKDAQITINGDEINEEKTINTHETIFEKTITLKPGKNVITFESDGEAIDAGSDPRTLVFRIINFSAQYEENN